MNGSTELRSIQYLRGIAALMVVVHHARHYFPEGAAWAGLGSRGVDIFFVISGFVMAHSTARLSDSGPRVDPALAFATKRFLRVVPLYWIALLWTTKRDWFASGLSGDLLRDLLFVPHFHAVYTDAIYPALVPGWTINYEMFFYGLFAAAILLGRHRGWLLPLVIVSLVVVGAVEPVRASGLAPVLFFTHSVLLEFALGLAVHAVWKRSPHALTVRASAAVSGLAIACLAFENGDRWRGLLDGVPAALLVWSSLRWAEGLESRFLRTLGDASYSIYLFHLASFAIAGWLLRRAGLVEATPFSIAVALAVHVGVATLTGVAIWWTVERPLLRMLRRSMPSPSSRITLPTSSSEV